MAVDKKVISLRLSPKLWEAVRLNAEQDLRSVNGEIEVLLREALRLRGQVVSAEASVSSEEADSGNGP